MKLYDILLLVAAFVAFPDTAVAAPPDAAAFIKARGWTAAKPAKPLKMPADDIVPVVYFADTSGSAGCGLLAQDKGETSFIEMLGPKPNAGWPQCTGINDVASFKMDKKHYLVFEITHRETQKHVYPDYFYVFKNSVGGYTLDDKIGPEVPAKATPPLFKGKAKGALEGVRLAKAALIQRAASGMALVRRDSLYADTAAYAVFGDQRHTKCVFILQTGGVLSKIDHTAFASGDACIETLATSRFDKNGKTYYMTMFRGLKQKRMAIVSVTKDNVITAERELAAQATAKAPLTDMRSVRMFLFPDPR